MRLNTRKLCFFGIVLLLLWITLFYSSMINVQNTIIRSFSVSEFDMKLEALKNRVDQELENDNKLLKKLKDIMQKSDKKSQPERMEDDFVDSESRDPLTVLPVLVIACNRVTVKRCLDNLVKYRPNKQTFPIIVSQDCGHNATYQVIKSYVDADPTISVVQQPDLTEIPLPKDKVKFKGYYKIARHFKFALGHVFNTLRHEAAIIVEDDLDISPDFFEYFLGTYPLLVKDPSLWCVSAWNDNGKKNVIDTLKPELLHRTDFFPGLGWMLRRHTWKKLERNWPAAFFDDWLRDPKNTEGRACIRPEISRTFSFGKVGVSKGLFFDNHLRHIHLNALYVKFTQMDLSHMYKERYDPWLQKEVDSAAEKTAEVVMTSAGTEPARVLYSDAKTFQKAAAKLGLMTDFRSGIPRTAYRGIVQCSIHGRRVYLVPSFTWTHYDPSWG